MPGLVAGQPFNNASFSIKEKNKCSSFNKKNRKKFRGRLKVSYDIKNVFNPLILKTKTYDLTGFDHTIYKLNFFHPHFYIN